MWIQQEVVFSVLVSRDTWSLIGPVSMIKVSWGVVSLWVVESPRERRQMTSVG